MSARELDPKEINTLLKLSIPQGQPKWFDGEKWHKGYPPLGAKAIVYTPRKIS